MAEVLQETNEAILGFVERWILLLSNGDFETAYSLLDQPENDTWSPKLIGRIISEYRLSPAAGDTSDSSRVTPVAQCRVVDYHPDQKVSWFKSRMDDNAGMVHYSLPINGIWSDLTAIFRIHRASDGVSLVLEDVHVM